MLDKRLQKTEQLEKALSKNVKKKPLWKHQDDFEKEMNDKYDSMMKEFDKLQRNIQLMTKESLTQMKEVLKKFEKKQSKMFQEY